MIKQMISFTVPQRDYLKREAKRLGISIAELVRRIIDNHIVLTFIDAAPPKRSGRTGRQA